MGTQPVYSTGPDSNPSPRLRQLYPAGLGEKCTKTEMSREPAQCQAHHIVDDGLKTVKWHIFSQNQICNN